MINYYKLILITSASEAVKVDQHFSEQRDLFMIGLWPDDNVNKVNNWQVCSLWTFAYEITMEWSSGGLSQCSRNRILLFLVTAVD